ncbi:MAG: polyprenyl synthetase family protein [Acidimicrobiia bacterium]|nr:polyprenyl synthetase family protein [Acidimicrobiia bacterium]
MSRTALDEYVAGARVAVEAALQELLPAPPGCPSVLAEAMRYSLTAGGKRLRPVLCLASAETVCADTAEARRLALPAACAIEMIHTYSLIHDDLPAMDDDVLRRGQPTLHVIAGEGMAILAGDGLLTEAFALMARAPDDPDPEVAGRKLGAITAVAVAAGAHGMVGGQAIDLDATAPFDGPERPAMTAAGLEAMHAKKTGALITAAAAAGAIMAGGDPAAVEALSGSARKLGLAFQIVDDILDVEGAADRLGKTAGKDALAGKPTYPALYGIGRSRAMAHDSVEDAAAILRSAGLGDSRLVEIGRWIVERRS